MKVVLGAAVAAAGAAVAYRVYKSRRSGAVAPPSSSSATQTAPPASEAYRDYADAFSPSRASERFAVYYSVGADKSFVAESYTRGDFLVLARKAAAVLDRHALAAGEMHTHFFSCNNLGDLAFRLASVMMGTAPVTINWQADTPERVVYKVELTRSRLVLVDDETPKDVIDKVRAEAAVYRGGILLASAPAIYNVSSLPSEAALEAARCVPRAGDPAATAVATGPEGARIVIFTSGTTGNPKGVQLPHRAYRCNAATFEAFLDCGEGKRLHAVVVNPMHHTNSTAITDWCLRKPGATLHLIQRYTTQYWSALCRAGTSLAVGQSCTDEELAAAVDARDGDAVVVAPLVSRHFDFLDGLIAGGGLPLPPHLAKRALAKTVLLLGSAPVGPTTVERLRRHADRLPTVRFGSTETCLQVMGTPTYLSEAQRLGAFEAGWRHSYKGVAQVGYYIGRPHPPFTACKVVKSVEASDAAHYLVECAEGEPGQLITKGDNLMSGYVGNDAATAKALTPDGWYTNLGDVVFCLRNKADGHLDFYWQSRDSALLIRGGANYAYDQINDELKTFLQAQYGLADGDVDVAVIGMRIDSEHEDACCVSIELLSPAAEARRVEIQATFLEHARRGVSKGAKPDRVRFGSLPRNFKGVIKLPDLKEEWAKEVKKLKQRA